MERQWNSSELEQLKSRFPSEFVWGTATASYQIEGAVAEDGRSPSIWDEFCQRPGAILNGDSGDVACDHYHRYEEDAALLGWLGARFYRFSFAWPRIVPDGRGRVEGRGLDFYSRLLDQLELNGVEPWATLYHWDLPLTLEQRDGGWTARSTADAFVEYALTVHDAFADRIKHWTTFNEPFSAAFYGYASGTQAPGVVDGSRAIAAGHHMLLAHGTAVAAMRASRPDHEYGITLNLSPTQAGGDGPADAAAARRIDARKNRFFLDPLLRGSYPEDMVGELSSVPWDQLVHDGDLQTISQPLDFLGVNYYRRFVVRGRTEKGAVIVDDEAPSASQATPYVGCEDVEFVDSGLPRTQMGWEIDPDGLRQLLIRLARDYDVPPMYITENGMARDDVVVDGEVADLERIAYVSDHLHACADAIEEGVDLRGYFAWSLLDNFEWALGLERRFGLVHVDYDSLVRTPKSSASWYRELVRSARTDR